MNRIMTCSVCQKLEAEGVYASRIAPVSCAYCRECMSKGAEPYSVLVTRLALSTNLGYITTKLNRIIQATLEEAGVTEEQLYKDIASRKQGLEQ